MRKLYFLLAGLFAASGFAQDAVLFQHIWHLDKIVMDEVDYFPDPTGNLNDITLQFQYDTSFQITGTATACNTGMGELVFATPGSFSIASLFNWTLTNCNDPVDAPMDSLYQSFFSGQVNAMGPYGYALQPDGAGNHTLVITAATGMQAFYHSEADPGAEILSAYVWLLDHMVMDGYDYYPPDALQQGAHLSFPFNDTHQSILLQACSGGSGEVFFPGNSIIQIPFVLAWLQLTCPIPQLVNFSIQYGNFYFHLGNYPYVLNDITGTCNGCPSPAYELIVYSPVGNVAYYHNQVLGTEAANQNPLAVYPNPASDVLHVPTRAGETLTVNDLTGRLVGQATASDRETILDVASLPRGIYLISVQSDSGTKQTKFIKR